MAGWQHFEVGTRRRLELIDITAQVAVALPKDADGAALLVTPHTTTALVMNEPEEGLLEDIAAWLERALPRESGYSHNRIDANADAHLRAIMLGPSLLVPVEAGQLLLGTWQRIFFVELDGPRLRRVRWRILA